MSPLMPTAPITRPCCSSKAPPGSAVSRGRRIADGDIFAAQPFENAVGSCPCACKRVGLLLRERNAAHGSCRRAKAIRKPVRVADGCNTRVCRTALRFCDEMLEKVFARSRSSSANAIGSSSAQAIYGGLRMIDLPASSSPITGDATGASARARVPGALEPLCERRR